MKKIFTILMLLLACFFVRNANAQTWNATGSMSQARSYDVEGSYNGILLTNGKVLVAGGYNGFLSSCELYDTASGSWSSTGSLATARNGHTVTLLPNGKVLVTGGNSVSSNLSSCELYDPASGSWSSTGSLSTARYGHTSTLLPNGKVMVTGGYSSSSGFLSSCELYDPAAGTWSSTGSLATARTFHTVTLLPNGKVLVTGGRGYSGILSSCELYDPAIDNWSSTGSLSTGRVSHTVTLLPNGKVLVTAGWRDGVYLSSCELYDTALGSWSSTGSLAEARSLHTATLLPNGKVLVTGGEDGSGYLSICELYDPASGSWSSTASLATARIFHTATLLPNGKVLVTGGNSGSSNLSSCELYSCTAPSIPSQSTATQTRCLNGSFSPISLAATGDGLSYQWYSNTTANSIGGTSLDSLNGAQTNSYTPQATTAGTKYYYCVVTGTCGADTSAVSGAFIVNPVTNPTAKVSTVAVCTSATTVDIPITVSNLSNAGSFSLSFGFNPTELSNPVIVSRNPAFDVVGHQWDEFGYTTDATMLSSGFFKVIGIGANSGDGISLAPDAVLFTLRFTIGSITTSAAVSFVENNQGTDCEFTGVSSDYEPFTDVPTATYYISGGVLKNTLTINTIADAQTICYNTTADLTGTAVSGGTITYKWKQSDTETGSYTDVSTGGTSQDYTTDALTTDTWFKREAISVLNNVSCSTISDAVKVTINATSVGGSITGTSIITYGSSTGTMTLGSHTGIIQKWQKKLDAGSWNDILNTNDTYSETPTEAGSWYYRAVVKSGVCDEANSNEYIVTVNKKELTISITAEDKNYDGNRDAITHASISSGMVIGDDVIVGSSNGLFDTKHKGLNKGVTADVSITGGADAANYTSNSTATTIADIAQIALVIGITAEDKNYDGNRDAITHASISSGMVIGDDVTVGSSNGLFDTKHKGLNKGVTADVSITGGADAANYTSNPTATTTAAIQAVQLTPSITADDKIYDGGTTAILSAQSVSGYVSGETVTLLVTASNFDNRNKGINKTVTATGLSLGGADASNYKLAIGATATDLANISVKAITVTGITANNKTYDGYATATLTTTGYILHEVVSPDVLTLNATGYTANFNNKNVGNTKLVTISGLGLSGITAANYTLDQPTGLTANILQKALTIKADDKNKYYDGLFYNPSLYTVTYTGLVTGESSSVLSGTLSFSGNATTATSVGIYTITPGNLTSTNYAISFQNGALSIYSPSTAIVLNNTDAGYGSLRNALANVNEGGTVTFDIGVNGQTITLTTGTLNINKNVTLNNSNLTNGITISGSGTNISINAGKVLTLSSGSKLTVTGAINNTAKGPSGLVIASGASFIHNTVDLPATVQRNLTNVWHLFGSPFKKNTGAMLANITGTTQMMPYTNGTGWGTTTTSPLTLFVPTVGYAIKPSATITASFTGNLYYSAIPADYTTSLIYNGTSATQSWNLVSNPYTASIDFNLLGKTNLSSTLYYWDNSYKPNVTPIASASYMRTYNSCNGVGVPAGTLSYIAPLQGFFVKAVYTSPKLAFTPSARVHKPITYYKDASNTEILVRLKTETEEGSDELVICKNENSKLDFEQFDSEKLFNGSSIEIYSQSTSGENLVINTINATANNIIPLGIRGNTGKKVKITAFALETAEQVYLEDRFKGKLISLAENTAYEFELPTENLIGRFFIRFNNTNAALTTSDVKVFENDNELNIIAQTGEELQTIEVYSLTGACVFKAEGNSNVFNSKLQLAPAVYMVRVKTSVATQNVKVSWK